MATDTSQTIQAAIDAKDYGRARALLKEALLIPTAEIYYLAACAALDFDQRRRFLERAMALAPLHPKVAQALAGLPPADSNPMPPTLVPVLAALDGFDLEAAQTLLRPLLQNQPSAETHYLATLITYMEAQHKLFLEKAQALDPHPAKATASSAQPTPQTQNISITQDSRQETSPPAKRLGWSVWRMVNAAFILLVFFMPWIKACQGSDLIQSSPVHNGFQTLVFMLRVSAMMIYPPALLGALPFLGATLGLVAFLAYIPLSLFIAFRPRQWVNRYFQKRLPWTLLGSSAWSLAYGGLTKIASPEFLDLYLGYWLAWVALISAAGVEGLEFLDYKKIAPRMPEK